MRAGADFAEAAAEAPDAAVLALADTDWLRHTLTLSGPAADVAAFQARAARRRSRGTSTSITRRCGCWR